MASAQPDGLVTKIQSEFVRNELRSIAERLKDLPVGPRARADLHEQIERLETLATVPDLGSKSS